MHKQTRRILFYTSILLFLAIGFWVVIYAYGYKLDYISMRFVKTGAVQVTTNISANVYLDDRLIGKTAGLNNKTFSVSKLIPKQYALKIQQDGYYPWNKQLDIKEEVLIDFNHVLLVKENDQFAFVASSSKEISPDQRKLLHYSEHEIWIEWLSDNNEQPFAVKGQTDLITRYGATIKKVVWYDDSNHLIASVGDRLILLEIDTRGGLNTNDIGSISNQSL